MTAPIEERLRLVFQDMADEVLPSPPPVQFQQPAVGPARWRLALVAAAVVVVVTLAVGAVALLREPRREFTDPIVDPPKILELSDTGFAIPGRSLMAVLPGASEESFDGNRVLQLLPAAGGPAEGLRGSGWVPYAFSQQMSWDGTRVIRQFDALADPRLEIVNLESGASNRLGGVRGYCPTLSPDNQTVAGFDTHDRLIMLSARDGRILWRGQAVAQSCTAFGWSPDGKLLAVPGAEERVPGAEEQLVVDDHGRIVARLGPKRLVNRSMSWSPDAHSLLLYDVGAREYLVKDITGGGETRMTTPPDGLRPMGWTGSRVVWLVGEPGDYRLVTTDRTGADPQTWMRIDAGDRAIESVQWSRDLIGQPVVDSP